jgi:hypothetical protein
VKENKKKNNSNTALRCNNINAPGYSGGGWWWLAIAQTDYCLGKNSIPVQQLARF